ncbi:MAG: Tad domain-containing protein, partial [Candidatus Promineifilaceae bacterium]
MLKRWQIPEGLKLNKEKGQSIALVAMMFVGLLAVVGISVDIGFVFARQAQLSSAVDAAVLAGVTEITGPDRLPAANLRASEFLHTHNLPSQVITTTFDDPENYSQDISILGERKYSLTVTWPVELYFLRVIGLDEFDITETATAAHFPLADIYASRRVEDGALSTSNQAVFGPHICTSYGDPFSSTMDGHAATLRQEWRGDVNDRTYHYRILIPEDYPDDVVRVELFDPDSINKPNNNGGSYTDQVAHTNIAIQNGKPAVESLSCGSNQKNACLIDTRENTLGIDLDRVNLWWFVRIDENRGSGSTSNTGNGVCGEPGSYTVPFNTITLYDLFYYKKSDDGVIEKTPLAFYYGQSGDNVVSRNGFARDLSYSSYNHDTDMRWVSPGGQISGDQSVVVPAGCGSPNGGDYDPGKCPGGTPAGPGNGFEVNINDDLSNILVDPNNGNRYIYLDVTSQSGSSENGYEIWAGPDDYVATMPSDVNTRNVAIINNPSAHSSQGATVFGLGHLPMNSNYDYRVDIPLVYLGPQYAGASVFVSLFDSDTGTSPPVTFFFDSISQTDWKYSFNTPPYPDGQTGRCVIGNCNDQFVNPPYEIKIPTLGDSCTNPSDPSQQNVCNPFYGGRLTASYDSGTSDTYHWEISLNGLP